MSLSAIKVILILIEDISVVPVPQHDAIFQFIFSYNCQICSLSQTRPYAIPGRDWKTFLKDLGAAQLDNLHDSQRVKPRDLSNHSLDPNRKQPSVVMDFKLLNGVRL